MTFTRPSSLAPFVPRLRPPVDPLAPVHDDDPYYGDPEEWSEYDSAYEEHDDSRWDREVEYQWATR